jgi:hypothetical protein
MGRFFLSEVAKTSILKTGLPTPISSPSQLVTDLSDRHPAQRLERSDLVPWHKAEDLADATTSSGIGGTGDIPDGIMPSPIDP